MDFPHCRRSFDFTCIYSHPMRFLHTLLSTNRQGGPFFFFPDQTHFPPLNVCHPHEEAASKSHYHVSFTAADVMTSLVALIRTERHAGRDADMPRSDNPSPSDRRGILTVVWMHRNLCATELPCGADMKLESHLIQRERDRERERERVKRVLKDAGSETKRTKPASVTVSSVRPGCILMETEYSPYRSEERK